MSKAQIGLVGLAVMGENLALNIADKGFPIAVFNRTVAKVDDFLARNPGKPLQGCHSVEGKDFKRAFEHADQQPTERRTRNRDGGRPRPGSGARAPSSALRRASARAIPITRSGSSRLRGTGSAKLMRRGARARLRRDSDMSPILRPTTRARPRALGETAFLLCRQELNR